MRPLGRQETNTVIQSPSPEAMWLLEPVDRFHRKVVHMRFCVMVRNRLGSNSLSPLIWRLVTTLAIQSRFPEHPYGSNRGVDVYLSVLRHSGTNNSGSQLQTERVRITFALQCPFLNMVALLLGLLVTTTTPTTWAVSTCMLWLENELMTIWIFYQLKEVLGSSVR